MSETSITPRSITTKAERLFLYRNSTQIWAFRDTCEETLTTAARGFSPRLTRSRIPMTTASREPCRPS